MLDLFAIAAAAGGVTAGAINAFTWRQIGRMQGVQEGMSKASSAHSSQIVRAAIALDVMLPKELKEKVHAAISGAARRGRGAAGGVGQAELEQQKDASYTRGYQDALFDLELARDPRTAQRNGSLGDGEGAAEAQREEA